MNPFNQFEKTVKIAKPLRMIGLVFFMFQAGLAILFSYPMLSLLSTTQMQWNDWSNWLLIAG